MGLIAGSDVYLVLHPSADMSACSVNGDNGGENQMMTVKRYIMDGGCKEERRLAAIIAVSGPPGQWSVVSATG